MRELPFVQVHRHVSPSPSGPYGVLLAAFAQVTVGSGNSGCVVTRPSRVKCAALRAIHQQAHSTLEPFTRS
jgi:hypothetical protein